MKPKKLNNTKHAVVFNELCIKENLLPKYSNINIHDRAVQHKDFVTDFRKRLTTEQISRKKELVIKLTEDVAKCRTDFDGLPVDAELKARLDQALSAILHDHDELARTRILKKLSHLYKGDIFVPQGSRGFVNLSSVQLSPDQEEFLNLGINCHYYPKFDAVSKKTEVAILFEDICKLKDDEKVHVNPNLQRELQAEATKKRHVTSPGVLTPRLRNAAKELRTNDSIVIRRADKSAIYVILDKEDYLRKIDDVLSDRTKFKPITRNPTETLKKKLNGLIATANAKIDDVHFKKITGEYRPGYLYGTIKTHKQGEPIRPIISQIPSPTYQLAKSLNALISPYIPSTHSVRSSEDFVDILKANKPRGTLASLDVTNLFTNVPVERTIAIILDYVYDSDDVAAPKLPRKILEALLRACTLEVPFRCPSGKLYHQIDGVAMGSPLGVLFANAFMCHVENNVLQECDTRPFMYFRYVDDIFVDVRDGRHLETLREMLENESGLAFTTELNVNNRLPFLDLTVSANDGTFETDVYVKPTNLGRCMNANGDCTDTYKRGVIRAYVRRALKHCSTWLLVDRELKRVKQMLVNNGYSNTDFDDISHDMIDKHMTASSTTPTTQHTNTNDIQIYYRNTITPSWRKDEKIIRDIVSRNVTPILPDQRLRLKIYYKTPRTSSLIMRNNPQATTTLQETNVVYRFKCSTGDCATRNVYYIGYTTTSLSRRLTMHLQDGGPKTHMQDHHGTRLTRDQLTTNTTILARRHDKRRLALVETIIIRDTAPIINTQTKTLTNIPLFDRQMTLHT